MTMTIEELKEENKRLEAWIDDLQSGMYINCVYCGHRYGPNSGPTTKNFNITMRRALEDHIAQCPKHPLSFAKKKIERLRSALSGIIGATDNKSLEQMKNIIKSAPISDKERDLMTNAIDVLLEEEKWLETNANTAR